MGGEVFEKRTKFYTLDYQNYLLLKKINRNTDTKIRAYNLQLQKSNIKKLDSRFEIYNRLNLSDCENLTTLPKNLEVNQLILSRCTALKKLPHGLKVRALDIRGCTGLTETPPDMMVEEMEIIADGCTNLIKIDGIFSKLVRASFRGCTALRFLPPDFYVEQWVDIGQTQIENMPINFGHVEVRWNSVRIPTKVVLEPENLTAKEILDERNIEIRRAMIERVGREKFIELAKPKVIDRDEDKGGKRELLKIELQRDEDYIVLAVTCPSTGRRYLIRVPPSMTKCKDAIAWTAGFENAQDYNPVVET